MLCHPPMRVFCSLLNSLYSLSNVAGFTCFSNCDARRAKTLFADSAYLAAYLASRREGRVDVRVAAPARMAVMTAARSPAPSCWLAVAPAMTFAAVILPATVPC